MIKKIASVLLAIATAIVYISPPPIKAYAVETASVTLDCDLPYKSHELVHNIPDISGETGISYCTVCHTAYFEKTRESFHPEGSPSGTTATRIVGHYVNMTGGSATESCSVPGCTIEGPHTQCACGWAGHSYVKHTRQKFGGPSKDWVNIVKDVKRNNSYTLPAHTYVAVRSDYGYTQSAYEIYIDGKLECSYDGYSGRYQTNTEQNSFYVDHTAVLTATLGDSYYPDIWILTVDDDDGTRWSIPMVYTRACRVYSLPMSSYEYDIFSSYHDGIKTDLTICKSVHRPTYIDVYLAKGQLVTVVAEPSSRYSWSSGVTIGVKLLNQFGTLVASDSLYTCNKTFLEVIAPADGYYTIQPYGYKSYDDGNTFESGGYGTILITNAIRLAQQNQIITPTLSATTVGYGDTSPTLTVTGAKTALSYKSSNTAVATITSGKIAIVGLGSTIFTISAAESSDYKAASATISLTVNKGNITVKALPTAGNLVYGQTLQASKLSDGSAVNGSGSNVAGNWAWKSPTATPNVGRQTFVARYTPTDTSHYNY